MKVLKFGGTSVQNALAIKRVYDIIRSENGKQLIVVSAMSGVTNSLITILNLISESKSQDAVKLIQELRVRHLATADDLKISKFINKKINDTFDEIKSILIALDILGEVSPKSSDRIVSVGEDLSSFIIFHYFKIQADKNKTRKSRIKYFDSRDLIKTDENYTEAEVDLKETSKAIRNQLMSNDDWDIALTQGFVASTKGRITTTLGRGGSDYSASIIASMINAHKLEIWTDVDGILTTDPRLVGKARLIKQLTYDEASELAYFGAKVLHPKTIYPAVSKKIPVFVLNTFFPDKSGTQIVNEKSGKRLIKAIAFRNGATIINIISNRMLGAYGFLSKVFEIFDHHQTSVDLVATSEVSISLTIDDDSKLNEIEFDLKKFAQVKVFRKMAIIAAVGEGIRDTAGIASRFFGVLNGINISMVSIGSSEINISIVVSEKDMERAVKLLHSEFLESESQTDIFESLNR